MVARGPGAVGCAHCKQLGAERPCGVCKHLVCERCGADGTTCDQPFSRTFQLPRGARLLDVDPAGRLACVDENGALRFLDLQAPRWVQSDFSHFAEEPGELVAATARREIVVERRAGGVLYRIETTGAVEWMAVASPYLAALVRGGAEDGLLLWKLAATPSMLLHLATPVRTAALSRDGRFLAAAFADHRVFVRDIEEGGSATFDGHRAPVTMVKFVGVDRQLVTADDKGRVVVRRHAAGGYQRELVPLSIRD